MFGNDLDAVGRFLETAASRFDAGPRNEGGRSESGLAQKNACEIARAHRASTRQLANREILRQVICDPSLQVANRFAIRALRSELSRELRLPSRAPQEHHQLSCHAQRDSAPVIFLDQGQRKVDSRGHPRRGIDVAIANEDWIGLDPDCWKAPRQRVAEAPVSRGAAAA